MPERKAAAFVAPAMPAWVPWTAGLVLLAGIVVYALIPRGGEGSWGSRGDAVGPFASLFNAGALFAALWAVHLQRQELAENREIMREHARHAEDAAKAQQDLAESQKQLADAQRSANDEAAALRYAQHSNTIGVLVAALANLDAAEVAGAVQNSALFNANRHNMDKRREQLNVRLNRELLAEKLVADALKMGFGVDPTLHTRVAIGAGEDDGD